MINDWESCLDQHFDLYDCIMADLYLRHVADYLTPPSRAMFRTVSPGLMQAVLPSPVVSGVASENLHHHILRWKEHITHLTILIDSEDSEGIIHTIPSLTKLEYLDIRSTIGDLNLWMIKYLKGLHTVHLVANRIIFPESYMPRLQTLRIVSGTSVVFSCKEGMLPALHTLEIWAHSLVTTACHLPESLEKAYFSVYTIPGVVMDSIARCKRLKHLGLEWCRLDRLPDSVGDMEQLLSLSLRGNYLTVYNQYGERDGYMLLPISNLKSLTHLDLSENVCLDLNPSSVMFPENLKILDVRGSSESYYNDHFFKGADLHQLEILYTSHLPDKETMANSMQNLQTMVYAPSDPVMTPFQTMIQLFDLESSFPNDRLPRIMGREIPCLTDGLRLFLEGPMAPEDCATYKDL